MKRPAETYPDISEGRMLRAIAEGDAVAFNAALAAALERHCERAGRHPRDRAGPVSVTGGGSCVDPPIGPRREWVSRPTRTGPSGF
ncbi:hypothetical protein [Actinomadura sp. 3N407]|uniref:hypothetical protein n=1 Tax=Actinomadura sp. 3N407 TaxID=3457423 RepID=UPI003FCC5566